MQTLRSATAATLSYVAALWLLDSTAPPLLAPLTALLVVQVTVYETLTKGFRRVNSVLAGVTVAIGFSTLVGLSWWSLGVLILSALTIGHLVRVGEFVPEVAISAMLVLGLAPATATALSRVFETLVGAAVGLLFNAVFVPPVWVKSAGESLEDLAGRMRRLLLHIGDELGSSTPAVGTAAHLTEAQRLDHDVARVDESLSVAEDSLRLNPRVKEGLLSRITLRTGLDTLEVCTVILRSMSRTMTDLAEQRAEEPFFPPEVAAAMEDVFTLLGNAVESYATLITTQVSSNAEEADAQLVVWLEAGRAERQRVAELLLRRVREHPRQWHLQGALLSDIDRMLNELDVEKRSERLAEALDQHSRERRERYAVLRRLRQRVTSLLPRRPAGAGT